MSKLYDIPVTTLEGEETTLAQHKDKTLLIVNTASKCGFTPQYEGLEKLHQEYGQRGLVILGFPCNQFGKQEPGNSEEIGSFCQKNYGVSFQMFSKIDVNGTEAHALYQELTQAAPGLLGSKKIKWNFTKFLVSPGASTIERFAPKTKPSELSGPIEALINS